MRVKLLIAVVVAVVVSVAPGAATAAGPPSPSEPIVLGFEPAEAGFGPEAFFGLRRSDRCPLGEGRVQVFYADGGRPAGTASICFLRGINAPYLQFYSAVITVNLAGGSVTATIGTSLTFISGFPGYTDPAGGHCVYGYGDLVVGTGLAWFETMSCAGPVTATAGVYSQASSGWLELTLARHALMEIGAEVVWTTQPTITITFS